MVKHIMADGRQVESMDGYVIPSSGRCEVVYRIFKRVYTENAQQKKSPGTLTQETDNLNEPRVL